MKCKECDKDFKAKMPQQLFCNPLCRMKWHNKNSERLNATSGPRISPGSTGAIAELYVCSDLLAKGYEVFRAVSPACSIDLIATKNNSVLMIEVRTGRYYKDKSKVHCARNGRGNVMAMVTHSDKKIHYTPPIE